MNRYRSKSGLFLMELLINLLLFCMLCGCGLIFFIKSSNLTKDATALSFAVSITSSVAGIYESGDGTLAPIQALYADADIDGDYLCIYLDEDFTPCQKGTAVYYVTTQLIGTSPNKVSILFYNHKGDVLYTVQACNHTPMTLTDAKEVAGQ